MLAEVGTGLTKAADIDMGPMRYASDVWRMIGGTMPIPAVYTARAGWEMLERLGVEAVRAKSLRQTKLLRSQVEARGFTVNTPASDDARGGTICFDFPGADEVSRELSARKFFHDYRPRCGLRVSPHYYTTDGEIEAFLAELDKVKARGPAASGVPPHCDAPPPVAAGLAAGWSIPVAPARVPRVGRSCFYRGGPEGLDTPGSSSSSEWEDHGMAEARRRHVAILIGGAFNSGLLAGTSGRIGM